MGYVSRKTVVLSIVSLLLAVGIGAMISAFVNSRVGRVAKREKVIERQLPQIVITGSPCRSALRKRGWSLALRDGHLVPARVRASEYEFGRALVLMAHDSSCFTQSDLTDFTSCINHPEIRRTTAKCRLLLSIYPPDFLKQQQGEGVVAGSGNRSPHGQGGGKRAPAHKPHRPRGHTRNQGGGNGGSPLDDVIDEVFSLLGTIFG